MCAASLIKQHIADSSLKEQSYDTFSYPKINHSNVLVSITQDMILIEYMKNFGSFDKDKPFLYDFK